MVARAMKIIPGEVTRSRSAKHRGQLGTAVVVDMEREHGWAGRYRVDTHGRSAAESRAEIERVRSLHEKKAARLDTLSVMHKRSFVVAGSRFRPADALIRPRGTDVEVVLSVKVYDDVTDTWISVQPLRRVDVYPSVDAVPSDDDLLAMMRAMAQEWVQSLTKHDEYVDAMIEGIQL
jgi:hypothetical protein